VALQIGILDKMQSYPPGLVADMMGMGTWRLNGAWVWCGGVAENTVGLILTS
jgi:hypothetical protein